MYKKTWKPWGLKDLLKAFAHYKGGIQRSLDYHLKKFGPLKFYITLGLNFIKLIRRRLGKKHLHIFLAKEEQFYIKKILKKCLKHPRRKFGKILISG